MEKKSAMQYVRLHTCDMGPSRRTGGRKDGRTAQAKVQLAAPKLHGKEWLGARYGGCSARINARRDRPGRPPVCLASFCNRCGRAAVSTSWESSEPTCRTELHCKCDAAQVEEEALLSPAQCQFTLTFQTRARRQQHAVGEFATF